MKPILNPITSKGYTRLMKKLSYLKNIIRKRAVEAIVKAKNHRDLFENAEYNAAEENFAPVEKYINDLEQVLSKINVVSENKYNSQYSNQRINFFLGVKSNGKMELIVGEHEANSKKNYISLKSSIAK